ncbi:MAG TPA: DUF6328 family protein [Actinomycetota bacterium]|nr:DUF6328 family protein [Actinomycetota bacterium]
MTPSDSGENEQENKKERIDRELIELLNELRVALPGVQVLFAFLLVLPVSQGFAKVDSIGRAIYFASLLLAAAASALLIAPSSYHRIHFRSGNKEHILLTSNRLAIAGLILLELAISGAIFVIANLLFANAVAALIAVATALWFTYFWFVLPLLRKRTEGGT